MHQVEWPVPAMIGSASPALIHRLVRSGEVCQQSLESMLVVHALKVSSGHSVLNLSAANTCLTSQILRHLNGTGLCVANYKEERRAHSSFQDLSELGMCCVPLLVTVGDPSTAEFGQTFDRVLCDVRCSNDGGIRQRPLPTWSSKSAQDLQALQVKTLRSALRHLRLGGRLVYATTSMNIVENEHVLEQVLSEGAFKLVEVQWGSRSDLKQFEHFAFPGIGQGMEACVRISPTAGSETAEQLGAAFFAVLEHVQHADSVGAASSATKDLLGSSGHLLQAWFHNDSNSHTDEVKSFFGMDACTSLVCPVPWLVSLFVSQALPTSFVGVAIVNVGLPLARRGKSNTLQICNEGAVAAASMSSLRCMDLSKADFRSLLVRRSIQVEMADGAAVVKCEGLDLALAAEVSCGSLNILTTSEVAARYTEQLDAELGFSSQVAELEGAEEQLSSGQADAYTIAAPLDAMNSTDGRHFLVVNGLRYCVPYERWDHAVLPRGADGMKLVAALSHFVRDAQGQLHDEAWWIEFCDAGRVEIEEHTAADRALRRLEEDEAVALSSGNGRGGCFRQGVAAEQVCGANMRVKYLGHVHERCIRAELPKVLAGTDRFLVVDKPAGLPSQGNKSGVLNLEGVLASMGYRGLHIAHRLDQPVSGVLVLGRSTTQQKNFMDEAVEKQKTYVARVWPPLASSPMTCSEPVGWDGERATCSAAGGKASITHFRALSEGFADGTQLVECRPVQGRRHQIRVHLAFLGSPIANDRLYGGNFAGEESGELFAFEDAEGVLAQAFAAAHQPWCPSCAWTRQVLAGAERKPVVHGGIWLHARRYQVPRFSLDVEAPLPSWASGPCPAVVQV
ncbi:unnamed protein product [Polarella glacialis]|uniref:SAM-dependent MTase RsmB/NOP-type domain-containing protein n=2 Tax=Polarella glacialis TaxID=89957 RepID=A0A813JTH3_POLGL|nr:unnamed protein product [Polarella glacialis]